MNVIEEEYDSNEEDVQQESEEKEEVENSFDLEQEKRTINEYNAEGNIAQTQIFIQNLNTLNANCNKSTEEINFVNTSKRYDLRKSEECSEFVEKYKNSEYLVYAIILSTFEVVALGDLPDLRERLIEYLPVADIRECDGTEENCFQQNPYISLNTILAVIGGKRINTGEGQSCTGLGEDSKQALINILEQFPILRGAIGAWLIDVNKIYKYSTTFDIYKIATAFARVISLDIAEAKRRIFSQLYENSNNTMLLGIIIYKLYQDNSLRKETENIILQWIRSDSTWLWKAVCISYAVLTGDIDNVSFEMDLNKSIRKRIIYFKKTDFKFISIYLIQSKYFRTMIANILHNVFNRANTREKKLLLAQIYINLIRQSYYRTNASFIELPLVACDTKQQQVYLMDIIEQIMSVYHMRKQLYAILGAYLKELSRYNCSIEIINHVSAYFYNIALSSPAYQQDTLYFLKNCNNKAARQIYDRLCHIYEKEGELYLHE